MLSVRGFKAAHIKDSALSSSASRVTIGAFSRTVKVAVLAGSLEVNNPLGGRKSCALARRNPRRGFWYAFVRLTLQTTQMDSGVGPQSPTQFACPHVQINQRKGSS